MYILGMDLQDIDTSLQIRFLNRDSAVKSARTQQRRIQNLRTVRRRQDQQTLGSVESIHLGEQLVECLLTLVVSAVAAGVPALSDRIDLIDENDTRSVFLGFVKQIPDTARADADEHFHKVRTGQ